MLNYVTLWHMTLTRDINVTSTSCVLRVACRWACCFHFNIAFKMLLLQDFVRRWLLKHTSRECWQTVITRMSQARAELRLSLPLAFCACFHLCFIKVWGWSELLAWFADSLNPYMYQITNKHDMSYYVVSCSELCCVAVQCSAVQIYIYIYWINIGNLHMTVIVSACLFVLRLFSFTVYSVCVHK